MNELNISGYGDDLTVNGVRIGDLTPKQHEAIELEKGWAKLFTARRCCSFVR